VESTSLDHRHVPFAGDTLTPTSTDLLLATGDQVVHEAITNTSIVLTDSWGAAQTIAKRCIDFVGATLLLLLLLPVLLVVAGLVLLSSPGPVLFRQPRVGYKGRVFCMHKFRTMIHNADPEAHRAYYQALVNATAAAVGGKFKMADDPRITRIGRGLRRFSLDELPQLWDVINGHMSLVGPRPPLAYEVELYDARERLRLAVKPGLTGLWQVSGRSTLTFQEMVDLDLYYIEHWSIWLDLRVLLRTPLAVLGGGGV
jgi:lipopolysaccharide/colanic/teichoic acid biosynthesis glycosyltransferase